MKNKLKTLAVSALAVLGLVGGLAAPVMAGACDPSKGLGGIDCVKTDQQQADLFGSDGVMTKVINLLLFIIGVVAVIMIIYGGIQYTTSAGDTGKVTNAKNTILYSVVGLVVALLAYALVNFVLKTFLQG